MNTNKIPLEYLNDSENSSTKKSIKIFINDFSLRDSLMPRKCILEEQKRSLYPFLFVNTWDATYKITMGQNVIKGNYKTVLRNSFIKEANRSGIFKLTDNRDSANYILNLLVDSTKSESFYSEGGVFIFLVLGYSLNVYENAISGYSVFNLKYQLNDFNNIEKRNNAAISRSKTPFVKKNYRDLEELRNNTISNMAESLSMSIKNSIETVITDINNYIK
jgi:hypothetical protein